jgi:hypothetical protein
MFGYLSVFTYLRFAKYVTQIYYSMHMNVVARQTCKIVTAVKIRGKVLPIYVAFLAVFSLPRHVENFVKIT